MLSSQSAIPANTIEAPPFLNLHGFRQIHGFLLERQPAHGDIDPDPAFTLE
jgi:hypothetical protein